MTEAPWRWMRAQSGGHFAYARGQDLVVEWYDHGEDAPYESANLLVFDRAAQRQLAHVLGEDEDADADRLAGVVAERFESYWNVKTFADQTGCPYRRETDFMP